MSKDILKEKMLAIHRACYDYDREVLSPIMSVKEGLDESTRRFCNIFSNDFDDAQELEKMTLKALFDELYPKQRGKRIKDLKLNRTKYWKLLAKVDTAVREPIMYVMLVACCQPTVDECEETWSKVV